MQPTPLDLWIIQSLAPFQTNNFLVDAIEILSENPLLNGFIFVVPLFLFWHFSEAGRRWLAQRLVITILIGTVIGVVASLLLQQVIRWPPPPAHPELASLYAAQFRRNFNPTSFPSDSTMLFSTVAFGTAAWSSRLSIGLLTWLLVFLAPARVFVGGHYPIDILAGLLLGFGSIRLAAYMVKKIRPIENLASSQSPLVRLALFLWLFEVGNGFADLRALWNGVIHIQRHL